MRKSLDFELQDRNTAWCRAWKRRIPYCCSRSFRRSSSVAVRRWHRETLDRIGLSKLGIAEACCQFDEREIAKQHSSARLARVSVRSVQKCGVNSPLHPRSQDHYCSAPLLLVHRLEWHSQWNWTNEQSMEREKEHGKPTSVWRTVSRVPTVVRTLRYFRSSCSAAVQED